jgi:hypothetical protein
MATRFIGLPESAHFPASNFPQITQINQRPCLAFDAATDEAAYWTDIAPQGLTGTLTLVVSYVMASATSGTVGIQAQIEAVTAGDATDLDTATSFDTVNNSASTTVPGTAGILGQITITMTNAGSIAVADYYRISVNRDADGSAITDSATGDLYLLAIELRDAA